MHERQRSAPATTLPAVKMCWMGSIVEWEERNVASSSAIHRRPKKK